MSPCTQIKSAFREKARKFHPDKMCAAGEAEPFIRIRKAYEILSDETSRSNYDRSLVYSVNSSSNIHEVDLGMSPCNFLRLQKCNCVCR